MTIILKSKYWQVIKVNSQVKMDRETLRRLIKAGVTGDYDRCVTRLNCCVKRSSIDLSYVWNLCVPKVRHTCACCVLGGNAMSDKFNLLLSGCMLSWYFVYDIAMHNRVDTSVCQYWRMRMFQTRRAKCVGSAFLRLPNNLFVLGTENP